MANLLSGFFSLAEDVNKVGEDERDQEGAVSELLPELKLSMEDSELLDLKKEWEKKWEPYGKTIRGLQDEAEEYWLGKQFSQSEGDRKLVDNLIFESLETFLPIATRQKAEPQVAADNTENGNELADKVRKGLVFLADKLFYNIKLKQVARYWALYMLGVMKVGWSEVENDITCRAVRPQKLILDPDGTVEGCVYTGYYIGELLEARARELILRFPSKATFIKGKVKEKLGTAITYTQWSTNDYTFWTLDDEVLGKTKNPHWNYAETKTQTIVSELGEEQEVSQEVEGNNHFRFPQMPYVFLSVFNLGTQPHDNTSLIRQNLPLQDLINKRLIQIDKNADATNGSIAVSGDAFTEEEGMKATRARRTGATIYVPRGAVGDAIQDLVAKPLPTFVYESLVDYRNELRNVFGTRGSSPQGTINEDTVGGKQIIRFQDVDRIGGGISTYLEQFSDRIFNWFVQLMYVYYDEEHRIAALGAQEAEQFITLQNDELIADLTIGVKEGSMIPHDPVSQRAEALDLWQRQGIDPITFFERLEFPDPQQSAKNLFLWLNDPVQLFPDLAQQQAQQQEELQAQEAQSQEEQQLLKEQERLRGEQNELQKTELQALSKVPVG